MLVREYQQDDLIEDRVDIYYRKKTKAIEELRMLLQKHQHTLIGRENDRELFFSLNQVCYFESVEKKTYAYLETKVIQIDLRLQELEEAYRQFGFVRVNKATILNIYHVSAIKPALDMRLLAVLKNGEKIQINRSYKSNFKAYLEMMRKEECA